MSSHPIFTLLDWFAKRDDLGGATYFFNWGAVHDGAFVTVRVVLGCPSLLGLEF